MLGCICVLAEGQGKETDVRGKLGNDSTVTYPLSYHSNLDSIHFVTLFYFSLISLWRRKWQPAPVFLENSMDRGILGEFFQNSWRILWIEEPGGLHTVHGVTKSQTRLSWTFLCSSFSAGQPGGLFHNKSIPCHLLAWNPEMASQESHRTKLKSLQRPSRSPVTCPCLWPLCSGSHISPLSLVPCWPLSTSSSLSADSSFPDALVLLILSMRLTLTASTQHIQNWPWPFYSTMCLSPTSLPSSAV